MRRAPASNLDVGASRESLSAGPSLVGEIVCEHLFVTSQGHAYLLSALDVYRAPAHTREVLARRTDPLDGVKLPGTAFPADHHRHPAIAVSVSRPDSVEDACIKARGADRSLD